MIEILIDFLKGAGFNFGFLRVFDDGTDVLYWVQYDAGLPPGGAP